LRVPISAARILRIPLAAVAGAALLAVLQNSQPQKPKTGAPLDSKKKEAIAKLIEDWFAARPKTAFEDWDPATRAKLLDRAKALDPIPASAEKELRALAWKAARKHGARLEAKSPMTTKWGKADYSIANAPGGDAPQMGLFIGLHGGGEGAGNKSEAQGNWSGILGKNKLIGVFPQAIQLVHDAWNTVEGDRFVISLVEMAKRTYDIDPNRVFVGGFSMGGTGSWFHAGRHPETYAAALPFSGVIFPERDPNKRVLKIHHGFVPNIRHVPLYYTAGADDTQCPSDTYVFAEEMLSKLRAEHPGEYETNFRLIPKLAHAFPPGEPQGSFEWIEKKQRQTFPKTLTWEVAKDPMPMPADGRLNPQDFYWLRCEEPVDFQQIDAEIKGQEVTIKTKRRSPPHKLTVYLAPELLDVDKEITITVDDFVKFKGTLEPSICAILESISARIDRAMVFTRRVELSN
jgi:predicted esterase